MKDKLEVIWEEPPVRSGHKLSKFDDIVKALLEHPGKWLRLPEPSQNSNSGLRAIVARHKLPIKITIRSRPDGLYDIYAIGTGGVTDNALPDVPDMKGYDA